MFSGPWAASRMLPLLEPPATGHRLLLGGHEDGVSSTDLGRQRSCPGKMVRRSFLSQRQRFLWAQQMGAGVGVGREGLHPKVKVDKGQEEGDRAGTCDRE